MSEQKPNSISAENKRKTKAAAKAAETKVAARDGWEERILKSAKKAEVRLEELRYKTARDVRERPNKQAIAKYAERWRDYMEASKKYKEGVSAGKELKKKPWPPFPRIWVVEIETEDGEVYYDVISGELRSLSAKEAGMTEIWVYVIQDAPDELLDIAIKANQRHGLQPSAGDIACCVKSLRERDPKITIREMANIIGTSKSDVGRKLSQVGQKDDKPPKKKEFDLSAFCKTMTKRLEKEIDGLKKESVELLVDHVDQIVQILGEKKWSDSFLDQLAEHFWPEEQEPNDP